MVAIAAQSLSAEAAFAVGRIVVAQTAVADYIAAVVVFADSDHSGFDLAAQFAVEGDSVADTLSAAVAMEVDRSYYSVVGFAVLTEV